MTKRQQEIAEVEKHLLYRKLNSTIMVVKAPDDRLRCDAAYVLDGTMDWSVFAKRPMSSQLVVVGSILRQDPAQVRFAQDNHMVNALATNRSDQPFGEAVLPWRAWGNRRIPMARNRWVKAAP